LNSVFKSRLARLGNQGLLDTLSGIRRGIEKEGLRTNQQGDLSQAPHPKLLGSALTHPHITTDYSESLLEFITPTLSSPEDAEQFLSEIHQFAYQNIADELVWGASMPCFLGGEDSIPIAEYGTSNSAQLKYTYRVGLAHRYGKMMQTIAGVHYNFSLSNEFWSCYQDSLGDKGNLKDFITEQYFALIRNFRRFSWLVMYFYGASPALCGSFLGGREHDLDTLSRGTLHRPYATSLRMGDLGYNNSKQEDLVVCYNSLDDYHRTLGHAISTSYPPYERIGLTKGGEYLQLNTNILQIENEYYSDIRPKRVVGSGEKPLEALSDRGVEYVEVRILDVNPFKALGIDAEQMRFLDSFLIYCLLEPSPPLASEQYARLDTNKQRVVNQGRDSSLTLTDNDGNSILMRDWAEKLMNGISAVGEVLDQAYDNNSYSEAIDSQREKLLDSDLTPSAKILAALKDESISFFDFAQRQTKQHRDYFLSMDMTPERQGYFENLVESSLQKQREQEAADDVPFDEYLRKYNE